MDTEPALETEVGSSVDDVTSSVGDVMFSVGDVMSSVDDVMPSVGDVRNENEVDRTRPSENNKSFLKKLEMERLEENCEAEETEKDDQVALPYPDDPPSYSIFAISGTEGFNSSPSSSSLPSFEETKTKTIKQRTVVVRQHSLPSPPREGEPVLSKKDEECGVCEKKGKQDSLEMKSWRQFSKNTTMHGIKYVFDERPSRVRR